MKPNRDFLYSGPTKMETASKTAALMTKLGYKGGRLPQLNARVTLVPLLGESVICHKPIRFFTWAFFYLGVQIYRYTPSP